MDVSDEGDVYVWGYSKACGHRRHDVLTPHVKVKGRNIVQAAGGGTHSMTLTASGHILSWGFGCDGQLGLGDAILTTSQPRMIRHQQICGRVSFVACTEGYSAAVTVDGDLYLWGKNNHVICLREPVNKPFFYPKLVNCDGNGQQITSVHSVYCGTWHAMALAGSPEYQPVPDERESKDISDDNENEEDEDDGMSSDDNTSHSRPVSVNSQGRKDSRRRPLETSSAPSGAKASTGARQATSSTHPLSASRAVTRMPTKLTLEEFYTLSDGSPSQDSDVRTSPRSQAGSKKAVSFVQEIVSPAPSVESKRRDGEDEASSLNKLRSVRGAETPETARESLDPTYALCPDIICSSPSPTSEISAVSESSLKKRMADNLSRSGGFPFRNRDWSGGSQGRRVLSPRKNLVNLNPEQEQSTASQSLTPKAASRTRAASLTERANTMFISKSTASHFALPREPTIISKQCVSLMDFENLRSGSVFDTSDDYFSLKDSSTVHPSSSSSSSRMDIVLSPTQNKELTETWGQKNPDIKTKRMQQMTSASDTPSTMLRSARMHEMGMDTMDTTVGSKRTTQFGHHPVMFNTPSPNFEAAKTNDYPLNIPLMRSRTMFASSQRGASKYYRKPGLPRATRPNMPKPGYLSSSRQHTFHPKGTNEKPLDVLKQSNPAGLENMASPSARLRGPLSQPDVLPSFSLTGQGDASPRRAAQTSATSWRTRQNTSLTKPLLKDASAFTRSQTLMSKSSFASDSTLMIGRKNLPLPLKPSGELHTGNSFRPYQNTPSARSNTNLKLSKKS